MASLRLFNPDGTERNSPINDSSTDGVKNEESQENGGEFLKLTPKEIYELQTVLQVEFLSFGCFSLVGISFSLGSLPS